MATTSIEDIETAVKAYILERFLPGVNPNELTSETPLIAGGILDSLATVRLVMYLEERFGIEIHAYEANAENLASLDRIAALVQSKRSLSSLKESNHAN